MARTKPSETGPETKQLSPKSVKNQPVQYKGKGLEKAYISNIRNHVDCQLETFFNENSASSRLGCAVRHGLLSPGKRFRPIITLLAYQQCSSKSQSLDDIDKACLDAACAVEMVHAASLVMDDLPSMDNARLRRGALTTHVVFGEGAGMLAAVALLNEAYKVLANLENVCPQKRLNSVNHLTNAIGMAGLAGGQDQDIACNGQQELTNTPCEQSALKEMEKRHLEKTGALFAAAAAIGGELAGAPQEAIKELQAYGYNLGLAYQAFDDVVDVACTTQISGKDAEQDAAKSTVVSLLGRDGAFILAQRHLSRAIGNALEASHDDTSLLADLAYTVGQSFGAMTE